MMVQVIHNLLGTGITFDLQIVKHSGFAKQTPAAVSGHIRRFRQAIGIEQQGCSQREVHLLILIVVSVFNTHWQVYLHIQQAAVAIDRQQHGGIMGSVTVIQVMGLHVKDTHEEGHENEGIIGGGNGMIHLTDNVRSTLIVTGEVSEQGSCDSHIEGCGYPFPCYVTDDERKLVTFDDEII